MCWTHISHSVADPPVRGNNVIHYVTGPQLDGKVTSALKVVGILVALKAAVKMKTCFVTYILIS